MQPSPRLTIPNKKGPGIVARALNRNSPSRCRIRTFFSFPIIIGINQAREQRTGIILPLKGTWQALMELPKPKAKPTLNEILAGLGPIRTTGQKIRYFRIKGMFTQGGLADRLGIGTPAVCQWEGGKTSPMGHHFRRLLKVLKVSPGQFEAGRPPVRLVRSSPTLRKPGI